jgi:diguanylate cyclase (GGDEF)-like protein/PAS domain S-box-containing protein
LFELAYTPYVWPIAASAAISAGLGIFAHRRRRVPAARSFVWLMAALTVWSGCYALELVSATLPGKLFWATAKYLGSASAPVLYFALALQLTGGERRLTRPVRAALAAFALGTLAVVVTNPLHHLYWTEARLVPGEPESVMRHGPLFAVYGAGLYGFVLASVALFVRHYRRAPVSYRRQAALLALGGLVPLAGRIPEDLFGVDLVPHLDNVILLLLLSGLLFAVAIFRFGAFAIVHVARDLVVRNIQAGIVVLDPAERVIELNPYAAELVGKDASAAIGQPLDHVLDRWPPLDLAHANETEVVVERNGGTRCFQVQSSRLEAGRGETIGYAVVLFDVTARKLAEQRLAELARTDALTGVTNRRHFLELAEVECARARRYRRPLSILMLDVDHFKQVNDRHGHLVGDEVLRLVAARLAQHMRVTDLLGRFGGEEFICLLGEGDLAAALYTAERLRQIVEAARLETDADGSLRVTISIGLAHARGGDDFTLDGLIERADRALYASKAAGRNRVTVADGPPGRGKA